jgi:glycosyltransferase involved in cell wall biosynthesis
MRYLPLIFCTLFAYSSEKQTICLNMIVKDEAKIICRCLDSVKHIIDYWVILDTGSSDGTQEVIRSHMQNIPGELHESPWKNWGETRSEAFNLAKGKGDYILFMDADDILEFDENFEIPQLTEDQYNMWRGTKSFSYIKPQIVKGDLPWKWVGVTHEYLACDEPHSEALLEGIHYTSIDDGATRSTGVAKYLKNVRLLEEEMKKDPENARNAFYLAESYRDSEQPAKALEWYLKRIKMGGWDEEVYWSKLQVGHMLKRLGLSANIVAESYKDAFIFRPHRLESIYHMAITYNEDKNYGKAYEILKIKDFIPQPEIKDALFNEDWISDYGLLFQMSIAAYYVGHYEEALAACDELLAKEDLPQYWRELTEINRSFPLAKMLEASQGEETETIAINETVER